MDESAITGVIKQRIVRGTMLFTWVTNLFNKPKTARGAPADKRTRRRSKPVSPPTNRRSYRAVSVYSRSACCAASKRLKNEKFLAAYAPILPLGGCSQPNQCRCRYRHYEDRRQEMRRDSDHGLPGRVWVEHDRRHRRRDRRKSQSNNATAA